MTSFINFCLFSLFVTALVIIIDFVTELISIIASEKDK